MNADASADHREAVPRPPDPAQMEAKIQIAIDGDLWERGPNPRLASWKVIALR
jgi:hypothetical protein